MNADTITAVAATAIALMALLVSLWQGSQNRRHNMLSVRPHLRLDFFNLPEGPKVVLTNNGIGPAIISGFDVYLDGHPMQGEASGLKSALDEFSLPYDRYLYSLEPEDSLAAGEQQRLIEFLCNVGSEEMKFIRDCFVRIELKIAYLSMYGEEFLLREQVAPPRVSSVAKD